MKLVIHSIHKTKANQRPEKRAFIPVLRPETNFPMGPHRNGTVTILKHVLKGRNPHSKFSNGLLSLVYIRSLHAKW